MNTHHESATTRASGAVSVAASWTIISASVRVGLVVRTSGQRSTARRAGA